MGKYTDCPKCEKKAVIAGECLNCGIVVEKYQSSIAAAEADVDEELVFIQALADFLQSIADRLKAIRRRALWVTNGIKKNIGLDLIALFSITGRQTTNWFRDVLDRLVTLAVYLVVACGLGVLLLSAADAMWFVYLDTPMGQAFSQYFPEDHRLIATLLSMNHFVLSAELCLVVTQACLIMAVISRPLFIMRLLHEGRGIIVRYICWPVAVAVLSGAMFTPAYAQALGLPYGWAHDLTVHQRIGLSVAPAIIVCAPCFELARRALPEFNVIPLVKTSKVGLVKGWQMVSVYLEKLK